MKSWFQVQTLNCIWMQKDVWFDWNRFDRIFHYKKLYLKVHSTHDSLAEFMKAFELGAFILVYMFSPSSQWPQNQSVSRFHWSIPNPGNGTRRRSYLGAFLHNSGWITKKIEIRNQLVRLARTSGTAYSSIDLFYFIL